MSMAACGAQETGGTPRRGGRALLSPGRLGYFLACTPSPLDQVRSKNHAPEGFILFGLRLILISCDVKNMEKTGTGTSTGHYVNRLVPKNDIK